MFAPSTPHAPVCSPRIYLRALALRLWAMGAILLLVAVVALAHAAWLRQVPHLSGDRLSEIDLPVAVALSDRQGIHVMPAHDASGGTATIALPPSPVPGRLGAPGASPAPRAPHPQAARPADPLTR